MNEVQIHKLARMLGLYMCGAPGMGKSGLCENLIAEDGKQGTGVCVEEPHGELIQAAIARLPANREQDVILLDIKDEDHPFGLNLFACANPKSAVSVQYVVDQVMHIFDKLYDVSRSTPRMAQYLRNCSYTLAVNPGYTMAEIPLLLTDKHFRQKLVANVTDPKVLLFWKTYEAMKPHEQREYAESTLNKLDEFLSPLVLNIVGQSKSTIDFRRVMDERKILLVKLDAQMDQVTSLIGAVIIAMLLNAAYSRAELPVEKRKQFNVYCDEFQRFATEDFATLLTEARKFGIGTTIAHQARYQPGMTDGIRATSLSASNLVIFKVSGVDAEELAGEFDSTPPPPEIIGQKPIYSPKRDVVDHLVRNGHKNPVVNSFTSTYLVPLTDLLSQNANRKHIDWTHETRFFEESILVVDDLRQGMHDLNNTLYACMVDHDAQKPISPYTLLAASFCFRFTQGVGLGLKIIGNGYNAELKHRFHPKPITLAFCQPNIFSNLQNLQVQIGKKDQFNQAIAFIRSLRSAMEALALDPILVGTGQHEPIYDKPRTYQDVQNECATRLANLPKYHAKVKIADSEPHEYSIKTIEPEKGLRGTALQERIERIRVQNRKDGYTRKREIVEAEIIKRQSQWSQQSGFQPPQPQGRLMPICSNCETQNQPDAKFCNQCGEKL